MKRRNRRGNLTLKTRNTSDITVRQAGLDDVASITSLCFQLGYPADVEKVISKLKIISEDAEHVVYVAEMPGRQIVGWVHGYIYKLLYSDLITEIAGLVVDKDYRGQGAGKKLMTAVEGWAKEKGCTSIGLRSNVIRKEAHAFYKNIGYDLVKEQYTFRKKM